MNKKNKKLNIKIFFLVFLPVILSALFFLFVKISLKNNFILYMSVSILFSLISYYLIWEYIQRQFSNSLRDLHKKIEAAIEGKFKSNDSSEEGLVMTKIFENLTNKEKRFQSKISSLENKETQLKTIHSMTESFIHIKNFKELLKFIGEKTKSITSATFCNIYLCDKNNIFSLRNSTNSSKENSLFPVENKIYKNLIDSLEPVIIKEIKEDDKILSRFKEPLKSYCLLPLLTMNKLIGFIELGFLEENLPEEETIQLLLTLTKAASISIENAQLYLRVSDKKRKTETILESITDGVISINSDGKITSFNKAAEEISGYSQDEVIGKPCNSIFCGIKKIGKDKISCLKVGCLIKAAHIRKQFPFRSEHIVTNPLGKKIVLEFISNLEMDKVSNQYGYVSVFRDISKLKEIEQLRSDFIDTVSHELRTPLTSIKGYIATLLHPKASFSQEELTEYFSIINEEADKLNKMINELIESSRLHKDALDINLQPFRINKLIKNLVKRRKARSSIHNFIIDLAESDKTLVDPQQIEFVLNHLLENAIKFSPKGGEINISTIVSNSDSITVMVEDQGIGIPAGHKNKIFNIFHRVDTRSTRRIYGPGLGLFLAKKIIEAHGKNIWMESGLEGGSKFVFNLPRYID